MDTVLLIVIMGAALYFLMIRPQQKRAKEQKNLMEAIAVGSRIAWQTAFQSRDSGS